MRRPLFAALCLLVLCAAPLSAAEKVIEIKERVFVSLTNEIYLNAEDYIGKKYGCRAYLKNTPTTRLERPSTP